MGGVTPQVAKEAMKLAASKLPIKTRFVTSESRGRGRYTVKVNEFRELEEDQLGDRLRAARRELYELRFKHAVGQLENSTPDLQGAPRHRAAS